MFKNITYRWSQITYVFQPKYCLWISSVRLSGNWLMATGHLFCLGLNISLLLGRSHLPRLNFQKHPVFLICLKIPCWSQHPVLWPQFFYFYYLLLLSLNTDSITMSSVLALTGNWSVFVSFWTTCLGSVLAKLKLRALTSVENQSCPFIVHLACGVQK